MVLMIVCGAAYSSVRRVAGLSLFFDGMNAAMVGVVGAVTVDLGRAALRSWRHVAIALLCGLLLATRVVSEPILAAAAVAIGTMRGILKGPPVAPRQPPGEPEKANTEPPRSERLHGPVPFAVIPLVLAGSLVTLAELVRVFVPIGVMTFGGGLAMIPAIEHTVVVEQRWLDPKAFADAIALGQVTPGPVAICSTFIGYQVGGVAGAIVATLAMFVPATALALAAGHSLERFRQSAIVVEILRSLAPAVIGMLGAATFSLGRAALSVHVDALLAGAAFVILLRRPISPLWLLTAGGLIRLAMSMAS
jgi:chromate transporter